MGENKSQVLPDLNTRKMSVSSECNSYNYQKMQLLYSFIEVNFPASGLNALLSASTTSDKTNLQSN